MWQTLSLLLITTRKVKMNATSISDMCKKWTMMTNIPSETQQQASHLHPPQISDATANQLPSLPTSHTHHITWQPISFLHCLHATPTSSHDSQSTPFTTYTPRPPRHDSQSTPFSAYTPRPPHHMTANQLSSPPARHAHLITWQPISFLHCLHATPTSSHDSQSTPFTAYTPRPPRHMTANQFSSLPTCHAHLVTWQPIKSLQCLQAMPTSSHDSQSTPLTAYKPRPPRHMTANQLHSLPTIRN